MLAGEADIVHGCAALKQGEQRMHIWLRPFALVSLTGLLAVGCSSSGNQTASAEASAAASAPKLPIQPVAKVDPLLTRMYLLESCYYSGLSLNYARAAYNQSLGGAEPGPGKIPAFGNEVDPLASPTPAAPLTPTPAASGSGAPATSAKPTATAASSAKPAGSAKPAAPTATTAPKAAGSATPSGSAAAGNDKMPRPRIKAAPYERLARACTGAQGAKEPALPELDPALAEYATFLVALSKDVGDANGYYQRGDQEKDSFAKGKELHKKLTDQFAKLDETQKKFATALKAFQEKNKWNSADWAEPRKLGWVVVESSRSVLDKILLEKPDTDGAKADLEKLAAAIEGLRKYGETHAEEGKKDPYARILVQGGEMFQKQTAAMLEQGVNPAQTVHLISFYTRILDGHLRSLRQELGGKGLGPMPIRDKMMKPRIPGHPE